LGHSKLREALARPALLCESNASVIIENDVTNVSERLSDLRRVIFVQILSTFRQTMQLPSSVFAETLEGL
jgi:hypothetical protein